MATTWPDTTVETPDGARVAFTLSSGLTPVNPIVTVGGASGSLVVGPTQYSFAGPILTLSNAPVVGEVVLVYFQYTTVSPPPATSSSVAGITTLATLRATAQQQADMVGSNFITTAEWNGYINASYYELYNMLVQKYGENYYTALDSTNKPYQFTTNGTSEMFSLPDGSSTYKMPDLSTAPAFFKGYGVDLWISSANTTPAQWFTLHRFNYGERNRWTLPNAIAPYGYIALRYRFEGNKLWLRPLPQSGQLIQVRYIPRLTALANDTDTADGISGFEEYIVVDTVIKAKAKEESDVSVEMARKAALKEDIEAAADNRDPGEPQTVVDMHSPGFYGGTGGGGMF